jgi:hypothetical protein
MAVTASASALRRVVRRTAPKSRQKRAIDLLPCHIVDYAEYLTLRTGHTQGRVRLSTSRSRNTATRLPKPSSGSTG